jgi:hypothetical protein
MDGLIDSEAARPRENKGSGRAALAPPLPFPVPPSRLLAPAELCARRLGPLVSHCMLSFHLWAVDMARISASQGETKSQKRYDRRLMPDPKRGDRATGNFSRETGKFDRATAKSLNCGLTSSYPWSRQRPQNCITNMSGYNFRKAQLCANR